MGKLLSLPNARSLQSSIATCDRKSDMCVWECDAHAFLEHQPTASQPSAQPGRFPPTQRRRRPADWLSSFHDCHPTTTTTTTTRATNILLLLF